MTTINKNDWFYQQGRYHAQLKRAEIFAEAQEAHADFLGRLIDTPREERALCLRLYRQAHDDFDQECGGAA